MNQNRQSGLIIRLALVCLSLAVSAVNAATNATEANTAEADTAYVDSVHSWGSWALGIEPAAGPQAPQNQPVNDRSANIQFRPNDNAAYQPGAIRVNPLAQSPTPPAPVAPPAPFFGGSPSAADPRNLSAPSVPSFGGSPSTADPRN